MPEAEATEANPCKNIHGNPCASKLVFLKPDDAKEFGTKPGANLMYCLGEGKIGPVVPVKDGADATRLGKKWCACSTSKDPSICAGEARLDRTAREHTEVLKFAGRRRRARSFSADRSQGRSRSGRRRSRRLAGQRSSAINRDIW